LVEINNMQTKISPTLFDESLENTFNKLVPTSPIFEPIKTLEFIVVGNQENINGNPIGYHRTTQKAKFTNEHQRYEAWKAYVQKAFSKTFGPGPVVAGNRMSWEQLRTGKVLNTTEENPVRVDIYIEYANNARPDNDNVFKGICDALFVNDKYVKSGSFDYDLTGRGRVFIKITFLGRKSS
jgi:Holliday junction resolvase RusA-like endonuclease